ncbi:MAG TPA: ATP-binding protein, partial [Kofleriaceae bacterium]|nr:ATP-binding protein [Kofleriaceae bacterium]
RQANEVLELRVVERTAELARSKGALEFSLAEVRSMQRELVRASRQGGMAEVAGVVLHNIGNVLTSVNVSAGIVADLARDSRATRMGELAGLLEQHKDDLSVFLTQDPRGRLIPPYLAAIARDVGEERGAILSEVERLKADLEHIMVIIAGQQSLARAGVVAIEQVEPAILLEEAVELSVLAGGGAVEIVRAIEPVPAVSIDRHMVLQILTNLLRNAQEAVHGVSGARIELRMRCRDPDDRLSIAIADNGAGIAPDHLARIFSHGFTTKLGGNGFGLHSSACSARVMGGNLTASSPGPGHGATFTLELPTTPPVVGAAGEEQSAA